MPSVLDANDPSTTLASLLAKARAGEEVLLQVDGRPIARVVPAGEVDRDRELGFGMFQGRIWMSDDFEAPLNEEELREWER